MRINKFLAENGICSRREADRLIDNKKVLVNGKAALTGMDVSESDEIFVDGKRVEIKKEKTLLLFNKPRGLVCSTVSSKHEGKSVVDFINYPTRIYPVGRLDKDSRGLLLLTDDGDLSDKLMRARNYHEKEYLVRIDKEVTDVFLKKMSGGVKIVIDEKEYLTRKCTVKKVDENSFSIVLTQGLNRQIRRMVRACGARVTDLKRTRILDLTVDGIKEGSYRKLKDEERIRILKLVEDKN